VVLATTENAAAISGSLLSFVIPILAAVLLLGLICFIVIKFFRRMVKRRS
jgi:hypothetical protein